MLKVWQPNKYEDHFYVEGDGKFYELSAHCLACAKAEFMNQHGIPVDIRGWHLQGSCGYFAKASRETLTRRLEDADGMD